jgi:maleate isomerase
MNGTLRVGLIVPSSNVTMETEIPALLRRGLPVSRAFSCHSSRMVMRRVTAEDLARMDAESNRCARELSDAKCDVLVYACLVAVMAAGLRYHVVAEQRLARIAAENDAAAPVVTSAGALVEAIDALGSRRVALIAPYVKPLTAVVVGYLEDYGIEVVDAISLEVADNHQVGRLDPAALIGLADRLDLRRAEAIVLSACVQMPSLATIQIVEDRLGLPVLSAATATVHQILEKCNVPLVVPDAGRLLATAFPGPAHCPRNAGSAIPTIQNLAVATCG